MRAMSNIEALPLAQMVLRGLFGDHAERRHRVGGMRLDLEPDPVARLRIPDRGHLQPAVARDHCVTRPLPAAIAAALRIAAMLAR